VALRRDAENVWHVACPEKEKAGFLASFRVEFSLDHVFSGS
jgi:hypothetical protein